MDKSMQAAREIITGYDGAPLRIMEVCGTHTHEIFRLGIRKLLPKQVELISGPGCQRSRPGDLPLGCFGIGSFAICAISLCGVCRWTQQKGRDGALFRQTFKSR